MSSSYHTIRAGNAYDNAMQDKEFAAWLRNFEPDFETEFWNRNIVAMYEAFNAGRLLNRNGEDK